MGRIFEKRKHKMFARYDKMAKMFTKYGKEIAMAVKQGGPDVETNSRLRQIVQNAKGANMPKDRIEGAIKRASEKGSGNYEEMVYEGYAPHGIAILVETATDNTTRTVANVRMYFNRAGGSLGTSGSLDFVFTRMGIFQIKAEGVDIESLELELIDFGAEEISFDAEENIIFVSTTFEDFGKMQAALEDMKLEVINSEVQRIPNTLVELTPDQEEEILKLVERIEEDDDVTNVFHNMK